jgi:biopolymer transport protein ExbD
MKFPRNARIFRGQLETAPFAAVFFLLLIFMVLGSLLYTPGVVVRLPETDPAAGELPGTDQPTVAVAVDQAGNFYFQNRRVTRDELQRQLQVAARDHAPSPITLLVQADKEVTEATLVDLALMARKADIHDVMLATLPRLFGPNPASPQ